MENLRKRQEKKRGEEIIHGSLELVRALNHLYSNRLPDLLLQKKRTVIHMYNSDMLMSRSSPPNPCILTEQTSAPRSIKDEQLG